MINGNCTMQYYLDIISRVLYFGSNSSYILNHITFRMHNVNFELLYTQND